MAEEKTTFVDGVDEENVKQEIWRGLNQLYSHIAHLINYKYSLLIYKLVKKNYVKMSHLEEATGYSRQRIHTIVNEFEEKEVERQRG